MELDVSCFSTSGARITGSVPIRSEFSSFLSPTSQTNLQVSYEFSTSRMAHNRPGMREAGIFPWPIRRSFTRGAQLASDFVQNGALMGLSDNKRTMEARLLSAAPVLQDNVQAYARLATMAALKETNNDPWESQSKDKEFDTSSAFLDMRGRGTSLDDSKLKFERKMVDDGIVNQADDRAGSRRSIENESFDNRKYTLGRNTQEVLLRKGERGEGADGMSPLSFRSGGNTADFGARNTMMDDRRDRARIDVRQMWKEENLYEDEDEDEDGERKEQINAKERSNGRYVPGARKEILKRRDEEGPLESSRKKFVGDDREPSISDNQEGLKAIASITDNRRILKRSKLIAKQIISQSSAMALGFVSQMWVNTVLWQVMVLEVKQSLLSGEVEGVLVNDVCQVGDVILVIDESALESELTALETESLVGYDLVTEDGYSLGKVRDYSFTLSDGKVTSLEFDSLGFSLVPSNLISTYWLDINEVMAVSSDSLLVKRGAESRARRLSKGILQLPRVQGRTQRQRLAGNRRWKSTSQEVPNKKKQMPSQTKQLPSRTSAGFLDDIELDDVDCNTGLGDRWSPMDYGSSQRKT